MKIVKASEMQQMDKRTIEGYGLPGIVLMENAGLGATHFLIENFKDIKKSRVSVLAGRGNNGGDGYVMARYLKNRGVDVSVYILADKEKVTGDAKTNLDLLYPINVPVYEITSVDALEKYKSRIVHSDIIIDAIFGTGLNSDVRGHYKDTIEFVNTLGKKVFSVDIPSGLNSDTGQVCGVCIKADLTATFGFAKLGHFIYPGKELTGKLRVIEIGIPNFVIEEVKPLTRLIMEKRIRAILKPRGKNSHKGEGGHLLLIGGSKGKCGAVIMAAKAAARTGAGLVTMAVPESSLNFADTSFLDGMTFGLKEKDGGIEDFSEFPKDIADGKRCIAIGPGLGVTEETTDLVHGLIKKSIIPLVIDADAINAVSKNPGILLKRRADIILTPHPGEMERLTKIPSKEIQKNRVETAKNFAEKYGVYLVLKGAATIIATPYGRVFINTTGNEGMAAGGMGDVLTGMIAAFITQGYNITDSAVAGVFLHGLCGDIICYEEQKPFGFLATDLIEKIPETIGRAILET